MQEEEERRREKMREADSGKEKGKERRTKQVFSI